MRGEINCSIISTTTITREASEISIISVAKEDNITSLMVNTDVRVEETQIEDERTREREC